MSCFSCFFFSWFLLNSCHWVQNRRFWNVLSLCLGIGISLILIGLLYVKSDNPVRSWTGFLLLLLLVVAVLFLLLLLWIPPRQHWFQFLNVPAQHLNFSNVLTILAEIFLSAYMAFDLTFLPRGLHEGSHSFLSLWNWSLLRFQAIWLSWDLGYLRSSRIAMVYSLLGFFLLVLDQNYS